MNLIDEASHRLLEMFSFDLVRRTGKKDCCYRMINKAVGTHALFRLQVLEMRRMGAHLATESIRRSTSTSCNSRLSQQVKGVIGIE